MLGATVVVLVVLSVVAVIAVRSNTTHTAVPASISTSTDADAVWSEAEFKRGAYTLPVPTPASQPTVFLRDYTTPTDWLRGKMLDRTFSADFTTDSSYNCGLRGHVTTPTSASCYSETYYATIFIFWAPDATEAQREYELTFTYTWAKQWWNEFDVMYSAAQQLRDSQRAGWAQIRQQDVVCRFAAEGTFTDMLAKDSVSCPTMLWTDGWLREQAQRLGVTITDY